MHSSVFLDKNADVIRPALLWCDGRTTEQCRQIETRLGLERMRDSVANAAFEGFTLPKILWLKQNESQSYERLAKVLLPKRLHSLSTDRRNGHRAVRCFRHVDVRRGTCS